MPLPPRPFHSLSDIANRWSVLPIDMVGWATEGLLALSIAAPPVKTALSRILCDLAEIAGTDVLPLFRPDGAKLERVCIRRIRVHGETEWQWISEPTEGLMIIAPDVLITRVEVERFARQHKLLDGESPRGARQTNRTGRRRCAGPGAPPRYDWDRFFVAITRRIYADGGHDEHTPDESTVRRKVALVWRGLTGA